MALPQKKEIYVDKKTGLKTYVKVVSIQLSTTKRDDLAEISLLPVKRSTYYLSISA